MTYRKIDTCIWTDPWVERLTPNAKLAFIYLWTNDYCNQAGFYMISKNRIKFDLGYCIDIVYDELKTKVELFPEKDMVWIKNFFRHQCQNSKFAVAALNSLKKDSFRLKRFIEYNQWIFNGYPELDLSKYFDDNMVSV